MYSAVSYSLITVKHLLQWIFSTSNYALWKLSVKYLVTAAHRLQTVENFIKRATLQPCPPLFPALYVRIDAFRASVAVKPFQERNPERGKHTDSVKRKVNEVSSARRDNAFPDAIQNKCSSTDLASVSLAIAHFIMNTIKIHLSHVSNAECFIT